MEDILGLNDNFQGWEILKQQIPNDAIAVEFHIKKKKQVNQLGKILDIDHAFGIVKFMQQSYFGKGQEYYALCDFGLSANIVHIPKDQALQRGEILKKCQTKYNISYKTVLAIAKEFSKNQYDLLENNCSHFIKHLQKMLQKYDEPTIEMDQFTDQQLGKGIKNVALLGGMAYLAFKGLQVLNQEEKQRKSRKNQFY